MDIANFVRSCFRVNSFVLVGNAGKRPWKRHGNNDDRFAGAVDLGLLFDGGGAQSESRCQNRERTRVRATVENLDRKSHLQIRRHTVRQSPGGAAQISGKTDSRDLVNTLFFRFNFENVTSTDRIRV